MSQLIKFNTTEKLDEVLDMIKRDTGIATNSGAAKHALSTYVDLERAYIESRIQINDLTQALSKAESIISTYKNFLHNLNSYENYQSPE